MAGFWAQTMNKEQLEEFGITKEMILDRVADRALEQFSITDEDGNVHSNDMEDYARKEIERRISKEIDPIVGAKVNETLEGILEHKFPALDRWGEEKGVPTSIKERMADSSLDYWNQNVDSSGKPCTSYGRIPRHEYLSRKVVEEVVREGFKSEFAPIIAEYKTKFSTALGEALKSHVEELMKKR